MIFELTLLGTNGAVPSPRRHASGQFLRTETEDFLIDCSEGTQIRLLEAGHGLGRCRHILISHLHGDHYFGLPGLITSLSLNRRPHPLTIHSPPGLRDRLAPLLELDKHRPPYPLEFREHSPTQRELIFTTRDCEVYTFPLRHRIPTNGYLIAEKERPRNILPEAIERYGIDYRLIPGIKNGEDLTLADGTVIPSTSITSSPAPRRQMAYCSDTIYFPELADYVRGVDLLYMESTFLHDRAEEARRKQHATAHEAALVAGAAGAGVVVLGHCSSSYAEVEPFEEEAQKTFPNAHAGRDLWRYSVPYQRAKK